MSGSEAGDRFRGGWDRTRPSQSRLFEAFVRDLLQHGHTIRFQTRGASMSPAIRDGEIVHVQPTVLTDLRRGDIVLAKAEIGFRLHRLVSASPSQDIYITRGDCGQQDDPAFSGEQIIGRAGAKEVRVGTRLVSAKLRGVGGRTLCALARGQGVATKLLQTAWQATRRVKKQAQSNTGLLGLLFLVWTATCLTAQVAVDASTSLS